MSTQLSMTEVDHCLTLLDRTRALVEGKDSPDAKARQELNAFFVKNRPFRRNTRSTMQACAALAEAYEAVVKERDELKMAQGKPESKTYTFVYHYRGSETVEYDDIIKFIVFDGSSGKRDVLLTSNGNIIRPNDGWCQRDHD